MAPARKSEPPRRNQQRSTTVAADREILAVAAFVAAIDALGDLRGAPAATQQRVMTAVQNLVGAIDLAACTSPDKSYGRRVIAERPNWSLAAITFRYGQETAPHDHEGWGGAITVRGIERERRFLDDNGTLILVAERDYRPGRGYVFDPSDIHQVIGADPLGITVALHFLVKGDGTTRQAHREVSVQTG
jgi:hypothetical protein